MKKTATVIALVLLLSVALYGQGRNRVPKLPAEWSLYLKDSGAPWENFSEVELDHTGTLVLIQHDASKENRIRVLKPVKIPDNSTAETRSETLPNNETTPDDGVTKNTIKLSASEAREIYVQAWRACRAFRLVDKKGAIAEGLDLTLRLTTGDSVLMIEVRHIAEIEKESPELNRLLGLIDKQLSKKH